MFDTIVIFGVGLLGGSLGLAARSQSLCSRVLGIGRNEERLKKAVALGAIDEWSTTLDAIDERCDLAVVCTPVGLIPEVTAHLAPLLPEEAIITDVGSTKAVLVKEIEKRMAGKNWPVFIGSHPMAGSEKTGVENARRDLYQGAACIVTPVDDTPPGQLEKLETFWNRLGSRMIRLSPEEHDRMVAVISHSPHLAASALALNFAQLVSADDAARKIVGEGFRDTTRVAAGDARMWRDICLDNRGALAGALNDLINTLNTFRDHIQQGNGQAIEDLLNQAREIRLSVHNNTS